MTTANPGSLVGQDRAWRTRRLLTLGSVVALAAALLLLRPVHSWILSLFHPVEQLIRHHPGWGMPAFVVLAALSAMLAFLSSALLIPVAVSAWGTRLTFLLLWAGWLIGGVAAYLIGRYVGRPAVERLVRPDVLARYESWARPGGALVPTLVLQLAIPSDVTGYLFGLVRCQLRVFLLALALAEIPYALGAVYLGATFLQGRLLPLLAAATAGACLGLWAMRAARPGQK